MLRLATMLDPVDQDDRAGTAGPASGGHVVVPTDVENGALQTGREPARVADHRP
jgi:hypothetical protein